MNCIFCKENSTDSINLEHIIPESLGNKNYILERGIVCDKCNNYFATKIEKILLDIDYYVSLRARNYIKNKRGKIPTERIIFHGSDCISEIKRPKNTDILYIVSNDLNYFEKIINGKNKNMSFSVELMPPFENYYVSRFLAKVAVEVLALRLKVHPQGLDYLINEIQFDVIREYARYGKRYENWPYYVRKIYEEDTLFESIDHPKVILDRLFEFTIFSTDNCECYLVLIFKGIEYTINIGCPEITSYLNWLIDNNNVSPLYLNNHR